MPSEEPAREIRLDRGIQIHGIEFTSEGIFELDEGRRTVFIDKASIKKGRFRRGLVTERLPLAVLVALGLCVGGAVLLFRIASMPELTAYRGVRRVGVVGVVFVSLGIVMLRFALRRGVYLELETDRGVRKLTVAKAVPSSELQLAIQAVHKVHGYVIEAPEDVLVAG